MNRVSCLLLVAIRFLLANDIQSVQTPITPQLSEELSRTSLESFIRINIVMKEQINSDILYSNVQSLSKANRRQFVINELKYFAQNTQGDILNQLSTLENTGQVKDVTSLWITNVINCFSAINGKKIWKFDFFCDLWELKKNLVNFDHFLGFWGNAFYFCGNG